MSNQAESMKNQKIEVEGRTPGKALESLRVELNMTQGEFAKDFLCVSDTKKKAQSYYSKAFVAPENLTAHKLKILADAGIEVKTVLIYSPKDE